MRSHTVFIDCQLSPPIVAGLPPISNGMRVQYVSTAVIFMAVPLPLRSILR